MPGKHLILKLQSKTFSTDQIVGLFESQHLDIYLGSKVIFLRVVKYAQSRPFNDYLYTGVQLPVQRGFFKNNLGDSLPTLSFLSGLYSFCNFVVIFEGKSRTMICKKATYFTDLEMIEYYQKMYTRNSIKCMKAKNCLHQIHYAKKFLMFYVKLTYDVLYENIKIKL